MNRGLKNWKESRESKDNVHKFLSEICLNFVFDFKSWKISLSKNEQANVLVLLRSENLTIARLWLLNSNETQLPNFWPSFEIHYTIVYKTVKLFGSQRNYSNVFLICHTFYTKYFRNVIDTATKVIVIIVSINFETILKKCNIFSIHANIQQKQQNYFKKFMFIIINKHQCFSVYVQFRIWYTILKTVIY